MIVQARAERACGPVLAMQCDSAFIGGHGAVPPSFALALPCSRSLGAPRCGCAVLCGHRSAVAVPRSPCGVVGSCALAVPRSRSLGRGAMRWRHPLRPWVAIPRSLSGVAPFLRARDAASAVPWSSSGAAPVVLLRRTAVPACPVVLPPSSIVLEPDRLDPGDPAAWLAAVQAEPAIAGAGSGPDREPDRRSQTAAAGALRGRTSCRDRRQRAAGVRRARAANACRPRSETSSAKGRRPTRPAAFHAPIERLG